MESPEVGIVGLYQALTEHRIHQDQLLWSRVQTLHLIQAGILGGSFALRFSSSIPVFGGILLILGGFLTFFLFLITRYDYLDQKVNQPLMDELAERLLPQDMRSKYKVRWTAERAFLPGHCVFSFIIVGFIAVDLILGVAFLIRP